MRMKTQSRSDGFDLTWSPIEDGPAPLQRFVDKQGELDTVVAMIGATPSTSGDMAQTARLADAVLKAAALAKVRRVLFASSSAVYGVGEGWNESDITVPISPYGRAKLEMERSVAASSAEVETCCLRIGNVAGADALLGRAGIVSLDGPIELDRFPDGRGPSRSYIGPQSLARALERLIVHEGRLPPVLNVATAPPVEMADLVESAGLPWHWVAAPVDRLNTQRITLDCGALSAIVRDVSLAATADAMVAELRNLGALA